ncbi:uncharacterized protein PHALS_12243 [Plasmopara halstedii]|uniref:Uncharacterized protein n=1 Tax=Plasmopara halstedii TaxID=4781 RepID=A0A0N7L5N0_PLAHL|nr:uncharacterized protein PHALS_12243 [Plasmopara halstedii]CEG41931.1 hypothetical protein PHALS_12243 [Plasmopara halstedii]|eukprot:XP_024578300.1 hypothetical protein PHALS_12243 [Plasmopara halstedii]
MLRLAAPKVSQKKLTELRVCKYACERAIVLVLPPPKKSATTIGIIANNFNHFYMRFRPLTLLLKLHVRMIKYSFGRAFLVATFVFQLCKKGTSCAGKGILESITTSAPNVISVGRRRGVGSVFLFSIEYAQMFVGFSANRAAKSRLIDISLYMGFEKGEIAASTQQD